MISSSGFVLLISVIALALAEGKTADELNILAVFYSQLGDTLATLAAIKQLQNTSDSSSDSSDNSPDNASDDAGGSKGDSSKDSTGSDASQITKVIKVKKKRTFDNKSPVDVTFEKN